MTAPLTFTGIPLELRQQTYGHLDRQAVARVAQVSHLLASGETDVPTQWRERFAEDYFAGFSAAAFTDDAIAASVNAVHAEALVGRDERAQPHTPESAQAVADAHGASLRALRDRIAAPRDWKSIYVATHAMGVLAKSDFDLNSEMMRLGRSRFAPTEPTRVSTAYALRAWLPDLGSKGGALSGIDELDVWASQNARAPRGPIALDTSALSTPELDACAPDDVDAKRSLVTRKRAGVQASLFALREHIVRQTVLAPTAAPPTTPHIDAGEVAAPTAAAPIAMGGFGIETRDDVRVLVGTARVFDFAGSAARVSISSTLTTMTEARCIGGHDWRFEVPLPPTDVGQVRFGVVLDVDGRTHRCSGPRSAGFVARFPAG